MNQRIHFAVLISKSSFNFLDENIKCHKYRESEALHEIGEVFCYSKNQIDELTESDRVINSSPKLMYIKVIEILSKQSSYTFYLDTFYIDNYFLLFVCRSNRMQHIPHVNWYTYFYLA